MTVATMTEADWHEWRAEGIGGSDIAALVGLSNYASPLSLYYEKTGQLKPDHEPSERQRIGRRMEGLLAEEFHDRTGLYCMATQTIWAHPVHTFARCTVDGLAYEGDDIEDRSPLGVIEFKTDGRFGWPEGVPANIRAQCVWEMGVTDSPQSWLVVMFAGFRVQVFEIPFDDDARADWVFMLDAATRFWDQVQTRTPPLADDHEATTRALLQVHDPDPTAELDADDTTRDLVDKLRWAKAATKAAKAAEDTLSNQLRAALGDAVDLVDSGRVIASWRPQIAARVDIAELRFAHPELVGAYTRETETRVLRLHTAKGN